MWLLPLALAASSKDGLRIKLEIDIIVHVMLLTRSKSEKSAKMILMFFEGLFDENSSAVVNTYSGPSEMIVERLLEYMVNWEDAKEVSSLIIL